MPFSPSRLLKKLSQPSLVSFAATDTASDLSTDSLNGHPQSSETTRTLPRPWRRKRALTGHSSTSRQSSTPPLTPKVEYSPPQGGMRDMLFDKPLPPEPSVFLTKLSMVSSPDMMPICSSPVQDKLAEVWDVVKDDARVTKMSRGDRTVGMCLFPGVLLRVNLILAFR
jgi:hypothetical protein